MPLFSLPPGVPPLLPSGYISFSFVPSPPLSADTIGQSPAPRGQWGLFTQQGALAVETDAFGSIEFLNDYRVSDYPQEEGAFQSYNKVATPFDIKIVLARGGTDGDRATFFSQLNTALASLDLYNVVTPEFSYADVTVVHVDYKRSHRRGVDLLIADVWVREIRLTGTSQFSNTSQPSGADPQNGGLVQPQPPTPNQAAQTAAAAGSGPPGELHLVISKVAPP